MVISRRKIVMTALAAAAGVFVLVTQISASGGASAACPAPRFPAFISMPGVTPRGVAVDKVGYVYVSAGDVRADGEHIVIWKFTPAGKKLPLPYAEIGQGTIGGLAVTADGDLYVAMAVGTDRGVWRVDREGQKNLLPNSNQIFFANGLAFDHRGTLYVTESVSMTSSGPGQGGIWRIPRRGQAELCLRDELLTGTGKLGLGIPIGANGIAYYHGNLYVTNTEKGTVLRIPVWPDGSVGAPEVWTTLQEVPGSALAGLPIPPAGDGVVLDMHGNVYVAVLTRSAVVRINAHNLSQETVAAFIGLSPVGPPPPAPLDFPASLWFGTGKGERTNLFVTNLGWGAVKVPEFPKDVKLPWAGPGLVKIDAGLPGQPLHGHAGEDQFHRGKR
jgi:sugar lactone lactonase YvrE